MVDPQQWGIDVGYWDAAGIWATPPAATLDAVLAAMGADERRGPYDDPAAVLTVRLDHPTPPVPAGRILLEEGGEVVTGTALPPDIPPGYHVLEPAGDGPSRPLIVSPGCCPQPPGRQWGWAAQLYAARSTHSWGIGDLADLARIGAWSAHLGAGVTLVNPLHAPAPGPSQEPSPYFASSRCFLNPLYLHVEDVPGASALADLAGLAAAGRALNASRLIDRDRVLALKSAALESLFARMDERDGAELSAFMASRGVTLERFATFNALAEVHGSPWQSWPSELHQPDGPGVARFASSSHGRRRIRYHAWLQWQLDRQLSAAAATSIIADLAVGAEPGGADSWAWQDVVASGLHVGAPPDEFNRLGQDWGFPPWDPWRLRAAGYQPFIETIRAGLRHGGGLRIDHVMGLFRLFWIPADGPPASGTYVRYPHWDLLNILALEAARAGAYVVGEDLGTVEDGVRTELGERGVLSYKVLWFEPEHPSAWPTQALGAVTTHDLPTIAGVWSGADLAAQRDLQLRPNEEGLRGMHERLASLTSSTDDTPVEAVIEGTYGVLAEAPCQILTASLDDMEAVPERPNMPGTVGGWPNWCLALPEPLEDLEAGSMAQAVAAHLSARSSVTAASAAPAPAADRDAPAAGPA